MTIRVMHVGLGPIGLGVVRQVASRAGFRSVGAVDLAPELQGRDLGDVAGLERRLRVKVAADAAAVLRATKPDAAVLCTSSSLPKVAPQIATLLKARVPVVSTTEELAYPAGRNRRVARQLDALARRAKVVVVGTGVNPGFAMDALPIALSAVCARVERVRVERVQDASIRRRPFQAKIGAGLTEAEFQERVAAGSVRHVGLTESITMLSEALGLRVDRITDEIRPRLAERAVKSEFFDVPAGRVCGLEQDGVGWKGDEAILTLHMEAYLGAPESYDAVTIEGEPPLRMKIAGGIHGDVATASITVNTIPKVLQASPGLHTMRSLALPSFHPGR